MLQHARDVLGGNGFVARRAAGIDFDQVSEILESFTVDRGPIRLLGREGGNESKREQNGPHHLSMVASARTVIGSGNKLKK